MPLVKNKGDAGSFANSRSLKALIQTLTTAEAANYFAKELDERATVTKKDKELAPLIAEGYKFAHNMDLAEKNNASADIWVGNKPETRTENFMHNMIDEAGIALPSNDKLMFGYAIDDKANLVGGFIAKSAMHASPAEKAPEENKKINERMFKEFDYWLASHGKKRENDGIYEATSLETIRTNERGEPIKADPNQLRELIEDKNEGFVSFLNQRDSTIELTTHHFTAEELHASAAPAIESIAEESPAISSSSAARGG